MSAQEHLRGKNCAPPPSMWDSDLAGARLAFQRPASYLAWGQRSSGFPKPQILN